MTRPLLLVFVFGLLSSIVCFTIAHALGGPDWGHMHGWR